MFVNLCYWPDLYKRRMIRVDELEGKYSSSDNSFAYKRGQASSIKTNYLHSSSVQTNLFA